MALLLMSSFTSVASMSVRSDGRSVSLFWPMLKLTSRSTVDVTDNLKAYAMVLIILRPASQECFETVEPVEIDLN